MDRGMSCLFSPGGITKVFFPNDHLVLPGFIFRANVLNCLSFLKLDFVHPKIDSISSAPSTSSLPALDILVASQAFVSADYSFPRLKLDSMLWHHHFGHIGMDATRAAQRTMLLVYTSKVLLYRITVSPT